MAVSSLRLLHPRQALKIVSYFFIWLAAVFFVVVVASDGLFSRSGATLGLWKECASSAQGGKTCSKVTRDCRVNGVDIGYPSSCPLLNGMRACGILESILSGVAAICLVATFRSPELKYLRTAGLALGALSVVFGIIFMALMVNYRSWAFFTEPTYGFGFGLLVTAWLMMALGCAVFWYVTRVPAGAGAGSGGAGPAGAAAETANMENTSEHVRLGPTDESDRT